MVFNHDYHFKIKIFLFLIIIFIFKAASNGHLKAVECLCEKGANIRAYSKNGWTPIMIGIYIRYSKKLKLVY